MSLGKNNRFRPKSWLPLIAITLLIFTPHENFAAPKPQNFTVLPFTPMYHTPQAPLFQLGSRNTTFNGKHWTRLVQLAQKNVLTESMGWVDNRLRTALNRADNPTLNQLASILDRPDVAIGVQLNDRAVGLSLSHDQQRLHLDLWSARLSIDSQPKKIQSDLLIWTDDPNLEQVSTTVALSKPVGQIMVSIHGGPNNVSPVAMRDVDHRTLATFVKKKTGRVRKNRHNANVVSPLADICLFSCSTGSDPNGFAQHLANKLGTTVEAPTGDIFANWGEFNRRNGEKGVFSKLSKSGVNVPPHWVTFHPQKAQKYIAPVPLTGFQRRTPYQIDWPRLYSAKVRQLQKKLFADGNSEIFRFEEPEELEYDPLSFPTRGNTRYRTTEITEHGMRFQLTFTVHDNRVRMVDIKKM